MPRKLDILLAKYLPAAETPRKLAPLTGDKPDPSEKLIDENEGSSVLTVHGEIAVRTVHGRANIATVHGEFSVDLPYPKQVKRVSLSRNDAGDIVISLHE